MVPVIAQNASDLPDGYQPMPELVAEPVTAEFPKCRRPVCPRHLFTQATREVGLCTEHAPPPCPQCAFRQWRDGQCVHCGQSEEPR